MACARMRQHHGILFLRAPAWASIMVFILRAPAWAASQSLWFRADVVSDYAEQTFFYLCHPRGRLHQHHVIYFHARQHGYPRTISNALFLTKNLVEEYKESIYTLQARIFSKNLPFV